MKRVVVPLAHGFEEIETVTVVDILRRAGISVTIAGVEGGAPLAAVEGRTGIKLVPDMTIDEVEATDFDMIVLPGGLKGTQTLAKDTRVARLLPLFQEGERYLTGAVYDEGRVVIDGRLVTSRGPGTAMEFAMVLVEILMGRKKVEEINQGVLAKSIPFLE